VDVVLTEPDQGPNLEAFCEVVVAPGQGRALTWPELVGEPHPDVEGWTWTSLWATWCVPCLEEMPRMDRFEKKLNDKGHAVTVQHVSVDATAGDLDRYRKEHPEAPPGPRVADQASVDPWLTEQGLDAGASIPIHIFADPQNRIRCIRMGAVSEHDYAAVEKIVSGD
jgi:thiol-disulfide isomerase/thioredoxin